MSRVKIRGKSGVRVSEHMYGVASVLKGESLLLLKWALKSN